MVGAAISGFSRNVGWIQERPLVHKAVLDVLGVDVPFIGFSKNPTERKERLFRQVLVMFAAFIFAPLHARVIAKGMSKRFLSPEKLGADIKKVMNIDPEDLMRVGYSSLKGSMYDLKVGIEKVLKKPVPDQLKKILTEDFRQNLVKAKSTFLAWDLAAEGLLFASIPWVKQWFSKQFLTGDYQFTGEKGVVSDKNWMSCIKKRKNRCLRLLKIFC